MGEDRPWWCWRCRAEKTFPHGWCATPGCDCDECLSPAAAELAGELVRKFGEWEFGRDGQPRDAAERQAAERELIAWAAENARRDDVIRAAYQAGMAKTRIAAITGIARTTVDRVLRFRVTGEPG
jgi:hypothetical protein